MGSFIFGWRMSEKCLYIVGFSIAKRILDNEMGSLFNTHPELAKIYYLILIFRSLIPALVSKLVTNC